MAVSVETLGLVGRALEGARVTGGRYDPTVLGDVLRAGYDRTFDELADAGAGGAVGGGSPLGRDWARVVVDAAGSSVTLPAGAGGDPRAEGRAPGGGSWVVGIEHPLRPGLVATVTLRRGAVATSSRVRRAWGPATDRRHHLIDPATGRPADTGLAAVTVLAARGWQAEVLAKAAFLGGLDRGLALLSAAGADGVAVDDHGGLHPSGGFGRFLAGDGAEVGR
jgi:thiamine biosynthesis lipoprotein